MKREHRRKSAIPTAICDPDTGLYFPAMRYLGTNVRMLCSDDAVAGLREAVEIARARIRELSLEDVL
jgi:hypothetical protein